ncbi:MAG: ATP synthase subunit I [Deltaproteobacteria bacterium]|nr:ATP synthase subunit I [Deltaproteobacteria bacterium]
MDPKHLDAIERWNLFIAALLILAGVLFFDMPVALGFTLGASLSCANFYAIHRLMKKSMSATGTKRAKLQGLLMAKMGVLMFLIFLAIKYLPIHPIALAVGLSVFLLSIAAESIRFALGQRAPQGQTQREQ